MAVETATKIQQLNPAWPLGTDPKSEGDNHIRLIKSVLAGVGGPIQDIVVSVKTTSGSYVKPTVAPFLKFLSVEMWGGGGGGGGTAATVATTMGAGAGGGAGGYTRKMYKASDLAASEAYTIGAGGAAGSSTVSGGVGGTSSFKGLTASGGNGGAIAIVSNAIGLHSNRGDGGPASGGDFNTNGSGGYAGIIFAHGSNNRMLAGFGGFPIGGRQATFNPSFTINDLSAATMPNGGGGHGSGNGLSQGTALNGAAGGPGMIILTEYF